MQIIASRKIHLPQGFTFFELIVTLLMMMILVVIALPYSQHLIQEYRATTIINQLFYALHYAKNEAILRGETIIVCGSLDQQHCDGHWSSYRIIFVDKNKNHLLDEKDELLRIYPPLIDGMLQLSAFGSSQYIKWSSKGYTNQQNGTFVYNANDHDPRYSRMLIINKAGRIRKANSACRPR